MEKIFTITILIFLIIIAGVANSAIIYVDDDNTEGPWDGTVENPFQYIQDGINAAINGDTVQVADGRYIDKGANTNTYLHIDGNKNITITSENGPDNCIIDCEGKNTKAFSLQNPSVTSATIISGFTMTGGRRNGSGGAITCLYASPTITNNKIIDNSATGGGGAIICQYANPIITNNIITGNKSGANGGAITCTNSNPIITNNTISGNSAAVHGGAIMCYYSSPEIINNSITDNEATENGGAIVCQFNYDMVRINDVIIDAGIPAIIKNNIIMGNSTGSGDVGYGGGIVCDDASPIITNNIIAGNAALVYGGAIFCTYSGAISTITYNTITGNSAVNSGGGIACYNGAKPTVLNTIFWGNTAAEGSEIYLYSADIDITYSDIQGGWEGEGNIDIDPLLDINYHLTDYSPCIGAGTDTPDITDDIDGELRPQPGGSKPDIGADENFRDIPLAVALSAFTATSNGDKVMLKWRTESEINNLGFKVYRSMELDGDYVKVTPAIIRGAGTEATPHEYSFTDEDVIMGNTYYYYIEDVDFSGQTNKSHIIKVTVGKRAKSMPIIPAKFALLQNFPNPFNPETWLPYDLAQDASVAICIYNTKGQLIRTIDLGRKAAGTYRTKGRASYWDGRDNLGQKVASGVYFYTLQTANYMETRRMVILK